MIDLTRLNGHRMVVNCDLIKFAEVAAPPETHPVPGERFDLRPAHRAAVRCRLHLTGGRCRRRSSADRRG